MLPKTPEQKALHNEMVKRWRAKHLAESRACSRRWKKLHPDKVRAQARCWRLREYHANPGFRLSHLLRGRVRDALSGKARALATLELLGCSVITLLKHLESQFRPGMSWENYGPVWHVDHITPCAIFNLNDPEQQKVCFHYTNLQPLFAKENLIKGDRIYDTLLG